MSVASESIVTINRFSSFFSDSLLSYFSFSRLLLFILLLFFLPIIFFFLPDGYSDFLFFLYLFCLCILGVVFVLSLASGILRFGESSDDSVRSSHRISSSFISPPPDIVPSSWQDAINYLDHAPIGFWSSSFDGELYYMNATLAQWLGIDLGSFVSGSLCVSDIVVGRDISRFPKIPSTSVLDISLVRVDGESLAVRAYYKLCGVSDGSRGEVRCVVCLSDSVQGSVEGSLSPSAMEDSRLQQQMVQGEKMRAVGQLAGGIAHDFNNVLTAIIGLSDLLLSNHRKTDPSFPDILSIKTEAVRAASLVRQLLAFSRRQTLRPQVLSISDILSDLRMLLKRLLADKAILDFRHGRDLWQVKLDMNEFERVIVNLCVNARDAIEESDGGDGTITITTSNLPSSSPHDAMPVGDYVVIEITDTGCGISVSDLPRIFDPFFSTKSIGAGTGLGLSTVYGIVKQSGGFIYADSIVGSGTTFTLYFPRHTGESIPATGDTTAPTETPRDLTGDATIIFAEDEDSVRSVGCRSLEARGFTVYPASSGVEALDLLETHGTDSIDLIVSDVVMPEMDGPTLLREVRSRGLDIPFIFASGYAEDSFEKNLDISDRGKFSFISKPYNLRELSTIVKDVLESKS